MQLQVRKGWDIMRAKLPVQRSTGTFGPVVTEGNYTLSTDLTFERPELCDFVNHWDNSRGEKELPSRTDILPIPLPRVLPWIALADVIDDGAEYRFRLCGTGITDILAREMRGETPAALPGRPEQRVRLTAEYCLAMQAPIRGCATECSIPGQDFQGSEIACLPLSNDGKVIDMLISVIMLPNRK